MNIALIIDIAVLILLAATVFMGFNLTVSLRNFRESRFEMEGLLNRLTSNIEHAEDAIAGLQNATRNSGVQLQNVVNDSKFLTDELKFMNEAGNGLADRLEKLAEKNRALIDQLEKAGGIGTNARPFQKQTPAPHFDEELDALLRGGDAYDEDEDDAYPAHHFIQNDAPPLQSQAERELYEALTRGKPRKSAGGRG